MSGDVGRRLRSRYVRAEGRHDGRQFSHLPLLPASFAPILLFHDSTYYAT